MTMRLIRIPIVAFLIGLGISTPTFASPDIKCRVLTIKATSEGAGIDDALRTHAEVFKRAPFSRYNTFRLINTDVITLTVDSPTQLKLPAQLGGSLELRGVRGREMSLTLTITPPGKKRIVIRGAASPGAPFFAAGLKANGGGVWIFGIACEPERIRSL